MLLIDVKENNGWLQSRWNLTYRVEWRQFLKACDFWANYYEQFEVVVEDEVISVQNKENYLDIPESESIVLRGVQKVLNVPIMITFYNQLKDVDVSVMITQEYSKADYEDFNKSLGPYLDSIELSMYR